MRSTGGVIIFVLVMLLLDLYVFQAVRTAFSSYRFRTSIYVSFWVVAVLAAAGFLLFALTEPELLGKKLRSYMFACIIGLFLAKLVTVMFLVTDDLRRGIQWAAGKLLFRNTEGETQVGDGISRSAFLSWLGLAVGGTLFGSLIYGFSNKYNYTLKKLQLSFEKLPENFKGTRIIHISDIHSGSLLDQKAVEHGVKKIMAQRPDMIVFTGDLVNDRASEMEKLSAVFNKLSAPLGVYSILGNHDYGDYARWPKDGISKEENLNNLKQVHAQMGWKLLMNEHVVIEKEGQHLALLGIENWSAKGNFPRYGRMDLAYRGTEKYPFKILLSHDPSHWDAEVKTNYSDIDLMLSGHTHGMQFGVEVPGLKWSPVQYMYKQWAGLYEDAHQKLYINRGFGFIGYPGRVGILPEITLIELT